MTGVQEDGWAAVPSHPEEIKSTFELRVGESITLQASARITPTGVISTGVALAAMMFAAGYLVSSLRGSRR